MRYGGRPPFWFYIAVALGASVVLSASESPAKKIDYASDIQPVLKQSCYECHGAEKTKSQLRLDAKQPAMQGGLTGIVIIPGKSAESLLLRRVLGLDGEDRMPLDHDPLPSEKIALLRAWIDQGALWPESASEAIKVEQHWAYLKPSSPQPPKTKSSGARNPIDNFIVARLEEKHLHPSPEAPRETLIRRLSLDLTGLPPTPAEVDSFVADKSPDAYDKLVERLLASPHFGERWARPWLDLARYADTNGYEKDVRRSIWKYRDWVINAFNQDMPFDQFTVEQLAGDLLPNASIEQKVATGFHRNTMYNDEGGVDREEQRWETLVDRAGATATVWLGATLACAQCHNHKFDPYTQKDFYQFLAFFDNADEPTMNVPSAGGEAKRKELEAQIAKLEANLSVLTPELDAAQAKWEREALTNKETWTVLEPSEFSSKDGATLTKTPDQSLLAGGARPAQDTYTVKVKTQLAGITAFRLETLTDKSLPASGPGRVDHGNFVLTEFKVSAAQPVPLQNASADFSQNDFPITNAIDGKAETGWAIDPEHGKNHAAIFETKTPLGDGKPQTLTFTLEQRSVYPNHTIGRIKLWATTAKNPAGAQPMPENVAKALVLPAAQRNDEQKKELSIYYKAIAPALADARGQISELRKQLSTIDNSMTTTLVMQEKNSNETPSTFMRIRGSFLSKGDKVSAATPAALPAFPMDQPHNRLGLARWLMHENNPLTARVAVNRFWEQLFGRGIVETSEDFGTQGARPSHPELLDWLAAEFMHQGWSVKKLLRTIVTSATYRQSSRVKPELIEKDPYNRLLARGPRFRIEAEMVRDVALAAGGLLSPKIGGPSVFPPQPDGIWDIPYNNDKWTISEGEDRYRRGLYTFIRRTSPYPMLAAFDAPSREFCCVRRVATNTPLQALTTLNDPAFIEAARGLAKRMIIEVKPGDDPKNRLAYGFRLCLSRQPTSAELEKLLALYRDQLSAFTQNSEAAKKMSGGAAPADAAQVAALTVVGNVLLNLDETLTKE